MISEGSCDTEDWSNDAENSALITGINYILKYILNIKNISQYYCFCCILDQTNTGLVNRRDFFKKNNKKNLTVQKLLNGSVYIYITQSTVLSGEWILNLNHSDWPLHSRNQQICL